MKGWKRATPETKARARALRGQGLSWREIGARIGVSKDTAHRIADPEFNAHVSLLDRQRRRERRPLVKPRHTIDPPIMQKIPEDTRDITGVLLGDPLPGRSALDRRQSV